MPTMVVPIVTMFCFKLMGRLLKPLARRIIKSLSSKSRILFYNTYKRGIKYG
jgi:hypothetical protein